MLRRVISTSILVPLCYLMLHFSHSTIGSVLFLLIALFLSGFGLYEFYAMVEKKGSTSFMVIGILTGLGYMLVQFLRGANPIYTMPAIPFSFVAFVIITFIFVLQVLNKEPSSPLFNFSMTIVGLIYVVWLLSFIMRINYYPITPAVKTISGTGTIFLIYAIAVTKGADSFAYLVGSSIGKHKLAPKISPNKTIEGAIGAVIGGVVIGILFKLFATFPVNVTWLQICVSSFFVGGIAQFGDLAESLLKRDAKIKDSGNKFPGLGGILDLVDSLLFSLPTMYFFMHMWILK